MLLGSLEVHSVDNNNYNKVFKTVEITAKPYHQKTTSIVCKIDTGAETNIILRLSLKRSLPLLMTEHLDYPRSSQLMVAKRWNAWVPVSYLSITKIG